MPNLFERDFSAKKRKKLASSGSAMKDGSFPIENEEDLRNAERLRGHAKDKAAATAHIKKRARALGLETHMNEGSIMFSTYLKEAVKNSLNLHEEDDTASPGDPGFKGFGSEHPVERSLHAAINQYGTGKHISSNPFEFLKAFHTSVTKAAGEKEASHIQFPSRKATHEEAWEHISKELANPNGHFRRLLVHYDAVKPIRDKESPILTAEVRAKGAAPLSASVLPSLPPTKTPVSSPVSAGAPTSAPSGGFYTDLTGFRTVPIPSTIPVEVSHGHLLHDTTQGQFDPVRQPTQGPMAKGMEPSWELPPPSSTSHPVSPAGKPSTFKPWVEPGATPVKVEHNWEKVRVTHGLTNDELRDAKALVDGASGADPYEAAKLVKAARIERQAAAKEAEEAKEKEGPTIPTLPGPKVGIGSTSLSKEQASTNASLGDLEYDLDNKVVGMSGRFISPKLGVKDTVPILTGPQGSREGTKREVVTFEDIVKKLSQGKKSV